MHPSLSAALVAAMLTATWWLGRRRVPLLPSTDTSDVAALNRAQIALVQAGGASQPDQPWPSSAPPPRPADGRGSPRASATPPLASPPAAPVAGPGHAPRAARPRSRAAYRASLDALFAGDGQSRLQAIEAAHLWGDRLCIPLLRRGLRDSDPAVMRAAALAMERFRGRTAAAVAAAPQTAGRPRRVSRTR